MLSVRACFPGLYEATDHADHGLWRAPCDLGDARLVRSLLVLIDDLQFEASRRAAGIDELDRISLECYRDILMLRQERTSAADVASLDVLQIMCALGPMRVGITARRWQLTYEWTIRSIADIDPLPAAAQVDFQTRRLLRLVTSGDLIADTGPLLLRWLDAFFYYALRQNVLTPLGWEVYEHMRGFPAAVLVRPHEQRDRVLALDAAVRIGFWGHRHGGPEWREILGAVEAIAGNQGELVDLRRAATIHLATATEGMTALPPRQRAALALREYDDQLVGGERLQLLGAATARSSTDVRERLPEFWRGIKEHDAALTDGDEVDRLYARSRMFRPMLGAPIAALLADGHVSAVSDLVRRWKGVADERERRGTLMVATPTGPSAFTAEGNALAFTPAAGELARLTASANAFLQTGIVVVDDPTFTLNARDRRMQIDVQAGPAYEAALEAILPFRTLRQRAARYTACDGLLVLETLPVPWQALLLRHLGRTLPLVTSLERPQIDRSLRRALVCAGRTATAGEEAQRVTDTLRASGVSVDVRTTPTAAAFADELRSPEWDLIWAASHSAFVDLDPHRSWIAPGEGTLTLADLLQAAPPDGERRLLVLNSCAAGSSAAYGGLPDFGLAGALTRRSQAVVAHAWPVDDDVLAPTFGTLLALELTHVGFFRAFANVLGYLQSPPTLIARLASVFGTDDRMVRGVRDMEGDFQNIFFWGSPVFSE